MSHPSEHDLQRLLAEESFVRELARQLLVGDADDVVQQTWLRAVQQGGGGIHQPRHWLARIVRNVAANLRRDDRRRRERQRTADAPELVPSTAALAEREERRRALVAAVESLPPPLRTVVLLRWFDGQPPRRIAAALGVSAATVSTQLHRALALLRERLDEAHDGDRRAWLVPLVPFVVRPLPPPCSPPLPAAPALVGPTLLIGAIAMTTKTKFFWAAAALILAVGAWMVWFESGEPTMAPSTTAARSSAEPVDVPLGERSGGLPDQLAALEREVAARPPVAATTGSVIVHVRYGDDHAPAAGSMLVLQRSGGDPRYEGRRQRADAEGTARFEAVQPGRFYVSGSNGPGKRVEVLAGQTVEFDLELAVGITVTGVVVDAAHVPVAAAEVEVTMMARSDTFPEVVAVTGVDGRFAARACPEFCLIGARAFGFTASAVKFLHGKAGNTAVVELVLGPNGGAVDGVVVDGAGKPIADAVVIVGAGKLSGIPGQDHIPPFPAVARSNVEGRFHAVGLPSGRQPAQARAPGFAPWTGTCEVTAVSTVPLRIGLQAGGSIRGTVRDTEGKAIDRADVEIGHWDDLVHFSARSAADGSFELSGLPSGELEVRADHDDFGKAAQLVRTTVGEVAACDLQLSRGLELKGRVIDPDGQPVAGVYLECMTERASLRWFAMVRTDAQGRFVAANCPESGTISISVRSQEFEEQRLQGLDPRAPDLQLQLKRMARSSVRIAARVVGPDGAPVANASVGGWRQDARGSSGLAVTDNEGRFELGPVPPGRWSVKVSSPEHPEFQCEPRELAADATWDLGTITLARGGTGRLRVGGTAIDGALFYVINTAHTQTWTVGDAVGGHRTRPLMPGDYLVLVSGPGVAAQTVPFSIRVGEETLVDVTLRAGVLQRFAFEVPAGDKVASVMLRVRRGEALVGNVWSDQESGQPPAQIWLAAGDYTVSAEADGRRGSAAFTVVATGGPPVVVVLR